MKYEIKTISKAKFDKMSKSKQQMAVAQDVIDRIEITQLKPRRGSFCDEFNEGEETLKSSQLSEKLKSTKTTCYVCAKGGLFMSYIGIANSFDVDKSSDFSEKGSYLGKSQYASENPNSHEMRMLSNIFSHEQLSLIETAFERTDWSWNADTLRDLENETHDALSFGRRYDNDEERLVAICKNIIKNKGVFIP